jgi:hypothetical protein
MAFDDEASLGLVLVGIVLGKARVLPLLGI